MNYIGIDHHKQYSHMTVMDEKGEVIKTGKVGDTDRRVVHRTIKKDVAKKSICMASS